MKITEREEQIIRIQSQSRYREINESLEKVGVADLRYESLKMQFLKH